MNPTGYHENEAAKRNQKEEKIRNDDYLALVSAFDSSVTESDFEKLLDRLERNKQSLAGYKNFDSMMGECRILLDKCINERKEKEKIEAIRRKNMLRIWLGVDLVVGGIAGVLVHYVFYRLYLLNLLTRVDTFSEWGGELSAVSGVIFGVLIGVVMGAYECMFGGFRSGKGFGGIDFWGLVFQSRRYVVIGALAFGVLHGGFVVPHIGAISFIFGVILSCLGNQHIFYLVYYTVTRKLKK